jgi:regulatory protein
LPKIVRVSTSKRNAAKSFLDFDNGEKLTIPTELLLRFGLHKDLEISPERVATLAEEAQEIAAYEKALELLSFRDHSAFELKEKLQQRAFSPELAQRVCQRLSEKGYLNDAEYAKKYARYLQQEKRYSQAAIRAKLLQKGISGNLLTAAENELSEEVEEENCRLLAAKKRKYRDDEQSKQKTAAYLKQKGFRWELIKRLLNG